MPDTISFSNDQGEALVGTLHLPDGPGPIAGVALGHCFTCSRHISLLRDLAASLAGEGMAALRFDFSGNGQSAGDFADTTYTKLIAEMGRAVDVLRSHGISRIGVAGHSMGAAIALLAGKRFPEVRAVAALAGRVAEKPNLNIFSRQQVAELEETGLLNFTSRRRKLTLKQAFFDDLTRYDLAAEVRDFSKPLLVVHGDLDEIIDVDNAHKAKRLNPGVEVAIVRDADHMFIDAEQRAETVRVVTEWFRKRLPALAA